MTTWTDLENRATAAKTRPIVSLFDDATRGAAFSAQLGDTLFDYAKTNIDAETRDLLIQLATEAGLPEMREAMFTGQPINDTEGRAVLHTALRASTGPVMVDGADVVPGVHDTLHRMEHFADAVRSGNFQGQGGRITDVVNIGIGGSDLGPVMATLALESYADGPRVHYVSNVDGAHIAQTMRGLDLTTTLVIVASKTFTTIETMTNAQTARDMMAEVVTDPAAQFVALSSATDRAGEFGIPAERVFGFEDWVGGRYSLWGPIGLPIMLAVGPADFRAFLKGGEEMDSHFRTAPLAENMPVMLALVGLWHHQFCGFGTRAVLPYDQQLARLPAYLQQLEMESNGKRVRRDGAALDVPSGPVVWGEPGTNGQHAFYQLIHQGTAVVPCEFLVAAEGNELGRTRHHTLLVSNCLAQSKALMVGRSMDEARALMAKAGFEGDELERQAAHRVFEGNRPSTTLIYPRLTPAQLGRIIALYEHRVFVEGVILGINSYDQWGVELGKELAKSLEPVVTGEVSAEAEDASTAQLVAFVQNALA
ncbi:glucose-6-phosphate isomerase [Actibacterium mucosum KCTC 23349]|uniref:Glucose-6-phosphate isomerase n=1 Tax=Actibacterium mucosum KCTC 23349 TaxID=1454373 RepID=A0A037ZJP7_9RHOB|nr:glucose-6-phosphate isomerase [Actibacterium mucosum]KAJ56665.1 glucose-6-phosphate isomerase [Actibacterium mucosum KCTC 23349]